MNIKKTCCDCESLQRIVSLGHSIQSLCEARGPLSQPSPALLGSQNSLERKAIPPINLPLPEAITLQLIEIGCSSTIARTLSDVFTESARIIQVGYTSLHKDTYQKWMSSSPVSRFPGISAIASMVESDYQKLLAVVKKMAIDRAHAISPLSQSRPIFNQEFVPLLEKYFEYNPYPSAADRSALARKSMMTSRQIEVWFQNHRNRAKKEGKVLRRNAAAILAQNISLDSLEKSMPFFVIPEKERRDFFRRKSPPKVEDESKGDIDGTVLPPVPLLTSTLVASPHAFPAPFSSRHDYDPILVKAENFKFPSTIWPRQPAPLRMPRPYVDVDELTRDFTVKLSMREPGSRKHRRRVDAHGLPAPWFASRYTVVPPAPYPALVRSPSQTRPPPTTSTPTPHHLFPPRPVPKISASPANQGRRDVTLLPKPVIRNTNHLSRDNSPAVLAASFTPSRSSSSPGSSSPLSLPRHRPCPSSSLSPSSPSTPPISLPPRPAPPGSIHPAISLASFESIDDSLRLLSSQELLSFPLDPTITRTKDLFTLVPQLLTGHA